MNETGKLDKQVVGRLRDTLSRKYSLSPTPAKNRLKRPSRKTYLPWSSDPSNPNRDRRKTLAMVLAEVKFGQPIEKLLALNMKGADIAKSTGLSQSCISRWRLIMGLRTTTENKTDERKVDD